MLDFICIDFADLWITEPPPKKKKYKIEMNVYSGIRIYNLPLISNISYFLLCSLKSKRKEMQILSDIL